MNSEEVEHRLGTGTAIATAASETALSMFHDRASLDIEIKGLQDWVSNADKSVETEIREQLARHFPDDGIIGEEHGPVTGSSGYTWVIDPIDGTTNFVNSVPGWCVVLACTDKDKTVLGIIVDPVAGETFTVMEGADTLVNGEKAAISAADSLGQGSVAVGHSTRVPLEPTVNFIQALLEDGGMYYRNGSGALMLAYVAAGRLIAYVEPHMNAWDCIAGLLMVKQSGGVIQNFDIGHMLEQGARVVASAPGLSGKIDAMVAAHY